MTQKNSCCKTRTLVYKCCGRNIALFTLSLLLQLIAMPVDMILNIQRQIQGTDLTDLDQRENAWKEIYTILNESEMGMVVLVVLAVLCGICMFRYLHVKQQTDFFHALPVSRGQLFTVRVWTGILAVVPAYLLSMVLSCGVCAAYGFGDVIQLDILLLSIAVHIAGFLLIYVVSILAAICCGNTLVSLLVCGWFQFGLLAAYEVLNVLLYVLYPARAYSDAAAPMWMSPILISMTAIESLSYDWNEESVPYAGECLMYIVPFFIAAVVIGALAYWLNRIRKSENAGLSIAFPKMEQPFKLYLVSVTAIFCGIIIHSTITSWNVMFFSMAIAALIIACVVEIIYHQDFNSLFYRWKSLLAYVVLCFVVLGCMAKDITGWNSRLPDRDQIVSASLSSDWGVWSCVPEERPQFYETSASSLLRNMYHTLSNEKMASDREDDIDYFDNCMLKSKEVLDIMYQSASLGAQDMKGDRSMLTEDPDRWGYTVTFMLKNGKTFQRKYYMPDDTKELTKNAAAVRFSEEYQKQYTTAAMVWKHRDQVSRMLVMNYVDAAQFQGNKIENQRVISDVLQTLYEESQELTQEYCADHLPVLMIRVAGQDWKEGSWTDLVDVSMYGRDLDDLVDIPVYACETDTLELLKESISGLETGFGTEKISSMQITTYTEDSEEEKKTILRESEPSEAQEIQKWLPYIIPTGFNVLVDPIYYCEKNEDDDVYVTIKLQDGTEMECYAYRKIKENP